MKLIDVSVLKEWAENWFAKNRLYHPYAKNNNIPITELYDILEQMPFAQPEYTEQDIRDSFNSGYSCGMEATQPEDWMERNKERILQAGMEGREIEFRIGGRLFAIREKAQ